MDHMLLLHSKSLWTTLAVIGGMLYGVNCSLAAPLDFILDGQLSNTKLEMLSAAATLSDMIAMTAGGFLADTYGRHKIALLAAMISMLASAFSSMAGSYHSLVLLRLVVGLGNGLSILVIPMYLSECVSTKARAVLIPLYQLGVVSGFTIPYIAMVLSQNWRVVLGIGAIPGAVITFLFCLYLEESPCWQQARNGTYISPTVKSPMSPLRGCGVDWLPFLLGILLAYTNNSIDACLFYGPRILSSAGTSKMNSVLVGLISNSWCVLALAAGLRVVRKQRRRTVLLLTFLVVVMCYLAIGLLFMLYSNGRYQEAILIVAFAILVGFYQVGPGLMFILVIGELFTGERRGKQMSVCTFFMSFFSLAINGSMLSLFDALGVGGTFLMYGLSYAACWCIFFAVLPETSHRVILP